MISSTFTDLKEHRAALITAINKHKLHPNVMEHDDAKLSDVIDSSLRMARDSAAYIGLIGLKYGQTPECADRNPDALSITELEFDEAQRLDRPILLFIMGDDHPVTKADIERDPDKEKKLNAFRDRAKKMRPGSSVHRIYSVFSSLDDFKEKIASSLAELGEHLRMTAERVVVPAAGAAPAAAAASVPLPAPSPFPPDPRMVGRNDRREQLVAAILVSTAPIIVTGGPGIGKTTLALAAAHEARVKARFGTGRIFVRLDAALEPRAVLTGIASALGLPASGDDGTLVASIGARTATRPILAILDNLETPWLKDDKGTEAVLDHLSGIEDLTMVLTIRGETPSVVGARKLGDVQRLDADDGRRLFVREAEPAVAKDPRLASLLRELDGHPLSIVLVARQTDGMSDLGLIERLWRKRRIELISESDDRLHSVRASLAVSLAHPRLSLGSSGRRLLSVLALLPAGFAECDLETVLPGAGDQGALVLQRLRLAEGKGGRLAMLAPLREAARMDAVSTDDDRDRLVAHFVRIAANGDAIGTSQWSMVGAEVVREADNLDAVCLIAQPSPAIQSAVLGLGKFHQFSGLATITSLSASNPSLGEAGEINQAARIFRLGWIALARSNHPMAQACFEEAAVLSRSVGNVRDEAHCVSSLGEIALRRSKFDAAQATIEAARALYRFADDSSGEASCAFRLGLIKLRRSYHADAKAHLEKALLLFRSVADVLGEANCICSLGETALARSDHVDARLRFQEAQPLYRSVGDVLGEANCISLLGDTALARSEHTAARSRFQEALPLYKSIGSVRGEANCIRSLGEIALKQSEYTDAHAWFEDALLLYKSVGGVLGEAHCIRGLGDIAIAKGQSSLAATQWSQALDLYERIPEPISIGACHLRRGQHAASDEDREAHFEAARRHWMSIDRADLVEKHFPSLPGGARGSKP